MEEEIPISLTYLPYFDIATLVGSAVSGLMVVFILIILAIFDPKLVDRVSLRFTFAISFIDFLKALLTLLYIFYVIEGPICTLVALFIPILTLMYIFLTMAIAVNLQLVFLQGIVFNPRWEYYYWGISLALPFVIMAFPLGMGQLGFDESSGSCWYKDSANYDGFKWVLSTLLFWIILGCAYCTVIVILTIISLSKKMTIIERITGSVPTGSQDGNSRKKDKAPVQIALKHLIRRVSLYCLIPIVSQMGYVLENIIGISTGKSFEALSWWSVIGTGSPGILNLLAFLLDPALYTALKTIRDGRSGSNPTQTQENESIRLPIRKSSLVSRVNSNDSPTSDILIGTHSSSHTELNSINSTFDDVASFDESKISELRLAVTQSAGLITHNEEITDIDQYQPSDVEGLGTAITYKQFIKGL